MKSLDQICKFFCAVWRSIVVIGGLVGLLYLPSDIRNLPKAYGIDRWELPLWLDRETVLFALLIAAGLYIIWIDIRPFVQSLWRKYRHSKTFTVLEDCRCEARYVRSPSNKDQSTDFMENAFYLAVGNMRDSGRTLRRVQARLFFLEPPTLCPIKDSSSDAVDLRHGEWALFEIGRIVSKEAMGTVKGPVEIPENRVDGYKHNVPRGHLSFEIRSAGNTREYGLSHSQENATVWTLFMVVSADDEKARTVRIIIDMTKSSSPVWWEQPA